MKTVWHKMFILLFAMAAIWVVVNLNGFLKSDGEAKQQAVAENWTAFEIILMRTCHAKWPLLGDEFDACVGKIKMYREDI